jgi:hypothetical protein
MATGFLPELAAFKKKKLRAGNRRREAVDTAQGELPLVPKLHLGTGLSTQLCCCLF